MFKFVLTESKEPSYRGKKRENDQNKNISEEAIFDENDYRCACYQKMSSTRITVIVGDEKEAVAQYKKAVLDFAERKGVGFAALQIVETDQLYPNVNSNRGISLAYVWCDSPGSSEFYEEAVKEGSEFDLQYKLYTCVTEVEPTWWPDDVKWQTFSTGKEAMAAYSQAESQYKQKALALVSLHLTEGTTIVKSATLTCLGGRGNATLYQLRRVKENDHHSVSQEDWESCPMSEYLKWDEYVESGENLLPGSDHRTVFSPYSVYYLPPEQRRALFDHDFYD